MPRTYKKQLGSRPYANYNIKYVKEAINAKKNEVIYLWRKFEAE